MVFNSLEFALFLPIVLLIYWTIFRHESTRDLFLLLASYFFYMSWYWQYAGLIAVSTIVDFYIGRRMASLPTVQQRRKWLVLSLCVNLGLLGFFKYFNFFSELSRQTLAVAGIEMDPVIHQLLLPVGISFYTFQTLSYTIDIYKGDLKPEDNFIKFSVFVSFFPQLVAGPIVRASVFLPQINMPRLTLKRSDIDRGLNLIFLGLFKKIIIADMLAFLAVDRVFADPASYSSWDLLMALYAYAFQIYCDFSGYSDIAIGAALLLGFHLPVNFNTPYLAQNPSEFWRRWHISLSTWLRDYLYISLGGNRGSSLFTMRNLMITMLLGGLWHGAALNFVLWGGFHGLILVLFRGFRSEATTLPGKIFAIIITFHLVLFSWLLFRVTSLNDLVVFINGLTAFSSGTTLGPFFYCVLICAAMGHYLPSSTSLHIFKVFNTMSIPVRGLVYAGVVYACIGFSLMEPNFIYFQF